MASISDEIHKWCAFNEDTFIDDDDCNELRALADRIDAEMVELPRDIDGVPIHVGDKVWEMLGDGEEETVRSITLTGGTAAVTTACHGFRAGVRPNDLAHTRPDSFEHIARDLEDWAEGNISGSAQSFADRIRKLAEREASNERLRARA